MTALAEANADDETGKTRRCIVTGAVRPRAALIRFVLDPAGQVTPDIDEKLPGRGLWVGADAASIREAARKNLFAKAAREKAMCPPGLDGLVAGLLRRKLRQLLGLARGGGMAVSGFPQVEAAAKAGQLALLLLATDAGDDGAAKLRHKLPAENIRQILTSQELGQALGQPQLVYLGLKPQPLTLRIADLCGKMSGFPQEKIAPEAGLAQIGHDFKDDA